MSKCNHCRIEISDTAESCPLCHNVLEKTEDTFDRYPDIKTGQKKLTVTLRILLFVWIAVSMVAVFINYQMKSPVWWSVIIAAVLFYPLYLIYMIAKDKGYLHRIFTGVIGANLLVILIDFVTGFQGWSVNYVMPGALIGVDLVLLVLMFVNRRNWQSYMIFQLLIIVIGLLPLLLIALDIVTRPLVSEIAFLSAVLVFLGTLILGGQEARQEMKRRFHV